MSQVNQPAPPPAVASAAAPTYVEGAHVVLSTDLTGALRSLSAGGGGGAATIADGANVVEGALADAAISTDTTGTISGKLRGLVKIFADLWDSTNHKLYVWATLRNAAGTEVGTLAAPVRNQGVGTQDVNIVSGGIPAITGFALESGGNLATLAGAISAGIEQVSQHAATMPAATTMQNAATSSVNGSSLPVTGYAVAILNVVSSVAMSGGTTVNFEASVDDTTWVAILAHQVGVSGLLTSTTTADGDFRINIAGYKSVRARISAYSAGTITVKGYTTPLSAQPTTITIAGTTTVQPGNTANTTPWLTSEQAATTGGLSVYSFLSTAAVQTAAAKASAGQVYALHFFNNTSTICYVRLYNMTTAPATTDTVVYRALVPASTSGAGFVVAIPPGIAFSTGIGIRVTAAAADNDATALAANAILGNVLYK